MKKIISKKSVLLFVVFLVIAGLLATTGYFYNEYQKIKKNPDLVSKEEVKTVTDTIKRYMDLPGDEEPTLATITDKEKLKDQDFFKNAQNGDKVLVYTTAKKAILYRPSTGRVIEFAPLILGTDDADTQPQGETSQTQQQPATVAIYNGTQISGLSNDYEKKLTGVSGVSVTSKSNASKTSYDKTYVIDVSGSHKDLASQLAQLVGGEVSEKLPDGENKPQADLLIIAGKAL